MTNIISTTPSQQTSGCISSTREGQIMNSRLGVIHYTDKDIYTLEEGLAGFKSYLTFIKSKMPGLENNSAYGVFQSLENPSLCFILFYPELTNLQRLQIQKRINNMMNFEPFLKKPNLDYANECVPESSANYEVAFLVVFLEQEGGKKILSCVKEAPLLFLPKEQKAWQIILG
jgi:flagellar assembly factor FliW